MATAASVTTDLTTCCICLDVFDNPKSLPCLHAFCLKCLQGYFKDKCPGDDVPCPLCRKDFQIPSDGLSGLQHHFFIEQLVEVRKFSSEGLPDVPCVVCLEESDGSSEEIATATVYCVDCRQKLCERCSRPHRRMAGGTHQLRALGAELEQELIQLQAGSCDKHRDKQVELYCHQCNKNICVLCFATKHRNHENSEIPEVAERFRWKLDADDQQIASAIIAVRNQLKHTGQNLCKFFSDACSVEKMVLQTGDDVKRIVDNQISELVSELQSMLKMKSVSAQQAHTVRDRLQLALVAMESFHTYTRELLDKGRPSDVTREACELHDRATELLQNDVTTLNFRLPQVTFTPADVTQLAGLNLVGKVTIESGDESGTHYRVTDIRTYHCWLCTFLPFFLA